MAPWPRNSERVDACRGTQPEPLAQWIAAEAAAAPDDAMDRACPAVDGHLGAQVGAYRGAVGAPTDQVHLEPVAAAARIGEQHVAETVAAEHPARVHEDVLIAVAVEVGDGDRAGFLKMAHARVGGDVGEAL